MENENRHSRFGLANSSSFPRALESGEDLTPTLAPQISLFIVTLFVVLTGVTRSIYQGDTFYYIESILSYSGGKDFAFWDFGHLLWRPAMWTVYHTLHWAIPGIESAHLVFTLMLIVNWIFGLGSLLLMARIVRRFANDTVAVFVVTTLAVSQAFLNYAQTGAPYIAGLFFLILGLDTALNRQSKRSSWHASLIMGSAVAIGVLLWLPYVFALPALFLSPALIQGANRESLRFISKAIIMCSLLGLGTYSVVAASLGLFSASEIQAWFNWASHSIDHIGGFGRAVFGFCRSWYQIENVGIEFRRFLLKDPFVHVSLTSLVLAGAWKLALTYLFIATTLITLLRGSSQDQRMLIFVLVAFVPVFAFGVKWQGGDMERYLAAFPAILLGVACALASRPTFMFKLLAIAFTLSLLVVNVAQDLRWVRNARDRELSVRLDALGPLPENSYVVLLPSDPLFSFIVSRSVMNSANGHPLIAGAVVKIGSSRAGEWRRDFASTALTTWNDGKAVWIFRGLLDPIPQKKWGWVEGAEPLVRWKDFREFFMQLETSAVHGEFVQLPPTPSNLERLRALASSPPSE